MTEKIKTKARTTSPFRYDIVGSYLRPKTLKEARAAFQNNQITAEELRAVEDREIIDLIKKQEAAGLKAVTDGEFRRSWWHLDFFWGFNGISKFEEGGYQFADEHTRAETAKVTGLISGEKHPFVEDFKFTREHTSENIEVKQTIPAPAQCIKELLSPGNVEATRQFYPTDKQLVEAVANAYQQVIHDLYKAGARTIQLDDCTWGMLVASELPGTDATNSDEVRETLKALYLEVNNAAIAGFPDDLTVNTHVCRGNFHSTWVATGAYDTVATTLFDQENVQAYYLEYDTDRSGGFEPLAKVSDNKLVVLGLVTSKSGELEDRQTVIDRVKEAAKYVPLDRLCLSTQCGFASTEEGNILTEEQQWKKVEFVKSVAEEIWGEEA